MNKKTLTIIIVILVIIGLPIAYWLISPLFRTETVNESLEDIVQPTVNSNTNVPVDVIEEDVMIDEPMSDMKKQPQDNTPKIISQGSFVGLAGHNAEGTARIYQSGDKYFVRFESDFKVTNGPDVFVYLGKNNQYDPATKLAGLKGNVGSQNYEVPSSINVNSYNEVWVWCRAFSVPFGKAELK